MKTPGHGRTLDGALLLLVAALAAVSLVSRLYLMTR